MNKKQKEFFEKVSKLSSEEATLATDEFVWQHFVETDKRPELIVLPKSLFGNIKEFQSVIGYIKVKTK